MSYRYDQICINDRGNTKKSPQIYIYILPTLVKETHGNEPKIIVYVEDSEDQDD